MLHSITFSDISNRLKKMNRESWLVKIHVVVTTRHIICLDTDNEVEFFRYPSDNTQSFYLKMYTLYQAMLNCDYSDVGKIRPPINKRYSKKLFELWKLANLKKQQKLSKL